MPLFFLEVKAAQSKVEHSGSLFLNLETLGQLGLSVASDPARVLRGLGLLFLLVWMVNDVNIYLVSSLSIYIRPDGQGGLV